MTADASPHAGLGPESLTRLDAPGQRALVLVLHGGKASSRQPVDARSASWKRMAAMQRTVTPALHEAGIGSWLLRYRVRGWNHGAPVANARWALDEVRRQLGDLPVVLLGHSMGGRTAAHVADDRAVAGVVALAPWWMPEDPVEALRGKPVLAAHGRSDKITSARQTRAFLRRAEDVASETAFHDMGRVGHYMFRRVPEWNRVATEACLSLLA
ncbi:alpha/beta hydrolase [Nocardioides litoris]|uniref:alpha/beta hydrolase n=1 Tax=Nocardioides litoris TaxID=1926648 RepID=UPI001B85F748|nr:alpha/beta fold hydrolase [Nocardioides litoris]